MRMMFEQSKETAAIIAYFEQMSIGAVSSFADAAKATKIKISASLPAYQSAKRSAEKRGIVIETIRGYGFKRINGAEMLDRAPRFFKRVRRGAKREKVVQEHAISTNLTRDEMLRATENISRLGLLQSTATPTSNRKPQSKPESGDAKATEISAGLLRR